MPPQASPVPPGRTADVATPGPVGGERVDSVSDPTPEPPPGPTETPKDSLLTLEAPVSKPPEIQPETTGPSDDDGEDDGTPAGLATAAKVVEAGLVDVESLTDEDGADIVESIYALEGFALEEFLGYETVEADSEGTKEERRQARRIKKAGKSLRRILQRHPELAKKLAGDIFDVIVLASVLGMPVIGAVAAKLKERKKTKEARTETPKIARVPAITPPKMVPVTLTATETLGHETVTVT
jgi:hypothetical protein